MDTTERLSENSRLGFEGLKAAFCPGSRELNSNTTPGLRPRLRRKGVRTRFTVQKRDSLKVLLNKLFVRVLHRADMRFQQILMAINRVRNNYVENHNKNTTYKHFHYSFIVRFAYGILFFYQCILD